MPPKRKRTDFEGPNGADPSVSQAHSRNTSREDFESSDVEEASAANGANGIGSGQSSKKKVASGKIAGKSAKTLHHEKKAPSNLPEHDSANGKKTEDEGEQEAPDGPGMVKKPRLIAIGEDRDQDVRMEDPPRGGLVNPVGFKTNPPPEGRPVRVYADGVFDLCHLGHMRQLEQAKRSFPNTHLTVGVTGDAETHRRKGLTVLSARERAETVRHCRWVDEVIEDCPWIATIEFVEEQGFDYVAHDDLPYGADEGDDIYRPIKEQGKFLVTQRTEGVSTTGIITKIVRDYEQYISRQLKRGTSRQELNVSWLKKNELDLKRHAADLRKSIKTNWSNSQELGKELRSLLTSSRPQSPTAGSSGWSLSSRRGEGSSYEAQGGSTDGRKSPPLSALSSSRLSHLEIPTQSPTSPTTPGDSNRGSAEFARGYSLGLVGGIRSWMTRNRRNVLNGSRGASDQSASGSDESNGEGTAAEGDERARKRRKRARASDEGEEAVI